MNYCKIIREEFKKAYENGNLEACGAEERIVKICCELCKKSGIKKGSKYCRTQRNVI